MILFRPGSSLTNPVSIMSAYKESPKDVQSPLGAHTCRQHCAKKKRKLEIWSLEPNPLNKGSQESRDKMSHLSRKQEKGWHVTSSGQMEMEMDSHGGLEVTIRQTESKKNYPTTSWNRPLSARNEHQSHPLAGQAQACGRLIRRMDRGPDGTCWDHWCSYCRPALLLQTLDRMETQSLGMENVASSGQMAEMAKCSRPSHSILHANVVLQLDLHTPNFEVLNLNTSAFFVRLEMSKRTQGFTHLRTCT